MVHDIVGAIRTVGDTVAVQIKRRVIRPVVAVFVNTPVHPLGANVFHLRAVADESITEHLVALGTGGEVDANATAFEPVAVKRVLVSVVDEHTFVFNLHDRIAHHVAFVGVVHHDPVVAITNGEVPLDPYVVGVHDSITQMVSFGNITRNQRVVRIHIVHRKPQVAETVTDECIVLGCVHKHTVAPIAYIVADHPRAGSIPNIDAVAAVIHAGILPPNNRVTFDQRVFRAVHVDADQITKQRIAPHHRTVRAFGQRNACIKPITTGA